MKMYNNGIILWQHEFQMNDGLSLGLAYKVEEERIDLRNRA